MMIFGRIKKILGLDVHYLLKGGSILGLGHLSGTLFGFLLALIFANLVDPHTYGQYKYILSIAGILGALTLSGVATTVLQSVAKGYEGALYAEQKLYLKWSLASIVASVFVGGYYIYKGDAMLGYGIVLTTVLSYIYNFLILHTAFLNAKKDFLRLSVNQAINGFVLLGSVTAAILSGLNSIMWIIAVYYGSQILFHSFAYYKTIQKYHPEHNIDPDDKHFSKHLSLGNVIITIAEYLDKILVFQYFGPSQLALYAFSVGVPDQIRGVNKLMSGLILPRMSTKDEDALSKSVDAHSWKYTIVSIVVVVAFYFLAPHFYNFFFPAYSNAAPLASLYMLLLPITAICTLQGYALQIKRNIKSLYTIRITDAVSKIVLYFICIPAMGVLGAVVAILGSKLFTSVVQISLYYYHVGDSRTNAS